MDDEILLVHTKKEAIEALKNIKEFLKQNLKLELKYNIRNGKITYKNAKKYLCGHIRYIQIADINGLTNKLFYM